MKCGSDKQTFDIPKAAIGTAVPAMACRMSAACRAKLSRCCSHRSINQSRAHRPDVNWSRGRTAGSLCRNKNRGTRVRTHGDIDLVRRRRAEAVRLV
jgi:hypothetical protein